MLLQLCNLSKKLNGRVILTNINLSLDEGEFVCLLGQSGSGKTTLLRLIAGFDALDEGEIYLKNQLIASRKNHLPTERRDIGIVFQDHALWPHMSIFDNVAFPLRIKKIPHKLLVEQTMSVLKAVSMEKLALAYPHQLSGGESQRIALARTLVQRPKLIIFDEPLASLDVMLRFELQGIIKELHATQTFTCLYITHDKAEAMRLGHRIAVLDQGEIVQCDTPYRLYHSPKNQTIAHLMGHSNCIDATLLSRHGDQTLVSVGDHTFMVEGKVEEDNLKESSQTVRICLRSDDIVVNSALEKGGLSAHVSECYFMGGDYIVEFTLDHLPILLRKTLKTSLNIGGKASIRFQGGWILKD